MNIACRSTQNVARIKRLLSLHIVIRPLNKKKTINSLLCWSVILLMVIQTLHSLQLAGRYIGDFGHFFSGFAKSLRVLRSSWILNDSNLYCKIVKYCILLEVCMMKTNGTDKRLKLQESLLTINKRNIIRWNIYRDNNFHSRRQVLKRL